MRTALSRMVAAGELTVDADGYRLVGRLLERKEAQDTGRRPAPRRWDGSWIVAVVTVPRRDRSPNGGRSAPTWRTCAWASCGRTPGCDRRTSPAPDGDDGLAVVRGPLDGEDPVALAARLWSLDAIAADRRRPRRRRLDAMLPALDDRRPEALPPTITLAAEVVRFLRAEPLLPPALTPQPWSPDALRTRYREFDRALGRTLVHAVRR